MQLENWLRVGVIFDIHFSLVEVHMQQGCKQMAGVRKIIVQTIISAEENACPAHSECFLGLCCCFHYDPVSRSFEENLGIDED